MPDKSLDWIRDVAFEDLLDKDVKLIHEWCGRDVLIALWENFSSMNLYISTKPLDRIRKRYIRKYFTGGNVKELCARLNVSERFVYEVLEEKGVVHEGQEALF
jgi:Mor family transcriptional regulator